MSLFAKIFSNIPGRHPEVPKQSYKAFTPEEQTFVQEVSKALESPTSFSKKITRENGTKIEVDFKINELMITIYPKDGSKLEFVTTDHFRGKRQWGGGVNSYNADGKIMPKSTGTIPKKFNTAKDVFDFLSSRFEQKLQKYNTQQVQPTKTLPTAIALKGLHSPVSVAA